MVSARFFSLLVLVIMFAMSLWARAHVPDTMAVHFNLHGVADGFAPRDVGVFMLPVMTAALVAVFIALPALMPKKGSLERSAEAYSALMIGMVMLMLVLHFALLSQALGLALNTTTVAFTAIGLLFVVMGNYMPKTRYNYVMGIRTPWTLADERVWDRTHRLAGPLFMLSGVAIVAAALFLKPQQATAVMLIGVFAPAIITIAYSWRVARQLGA